MKMSFASRWKRKTLTAVDGKRKAERVGFEPTVGLTLRRFSRPVHSATLPPLRDFCLRLGRQDGNARKRL